MLTGYWRKTTELHLFVIVTKLTSMNNHLSHYTAKQLISALANKELSAVELMKYTITRIEQLDNSINAVVVRDFEQALQAAKAADQAIARNQLLPLLGLPMTVKESFNLTDIPTTWGNPVFKDWRPDADSLVVSRLKQAGAIVIGKTNVPFMLHDWQAYNEIYGTTNNPWKPNHTPGGSSGGSAAALAAGFVTLELGSDLAGSIRVPASFCGVYGHKPSVHLVPLRGSTPPMSPPSPTPVVDLPVAGPMARSADDLALALDVIAGPDELWDGKGYELKLPKPKHSRLNNYRVLVLKEHPLCPTSKPVLHALDNLVVQLNQAHVATSENSNQLPDLAEITRVYSILFGGFVGASMPEEIYQQTHSHANALSSNDQSISADLTRGCIVSHRDWLNTLRKRDQLREQFRSVFNQFDVIVCPVMPTPAFLHDHSPIENREINIDGNMHPYSAAFVWPCIANLFGLPATAAPIASTDNGLPIGIQIIGDYLEDHTTIEFARLLELELSAFAMPELPEATITAL